MGTSELTVREFLRYATGCGPWEWVRSDFAAEFDRLRQDGALTPGGVSPTLWQTSSKFVLKLATGSGFAVYKNSFRFRYGAKYWLRPSPSAMEAFNMMRLARMGFPVPELLAVGETRSFRSLKGSFLVSSFIESRDGRDFRPDGIHAADEALKMRFCRAHLALLAKLHDLGFLHRNFTPFNLLYRLDGDTLHSWWIDLATCRRAYGITARDIAGEIFKLLKFLDLSADRRRELVGAYAEASRKPRNVDALCGIIDRLLLEKQKKDQLKARSAANGKRG